jgi:hypothetical protein
MMGCGISLALLNVMKNRRVNQQERRPGGGGNEKDNSSRIAGGNAFHGNGPCHE